MGLAMRLLLCLMIGLWAVCAAADTISPPLPALYDVDGVSSDDTLNIRAAPDASAAVIGKLAPDAKAVEVTGFSHQGGWARINVAETTGWVALRFLTAAAPNTTAIGLPRGLTCFGTEPFWDITFLDEPNLIVSTPMGQSGHVILNTSPNAAFVDLARAGFRFQWRSEGMDVTAHILPGQCSDGMSDRSYGLHYVDDLGLGVGCCSLR